MTAFPGWHIRIGGLALARRVRNSGVGLGEHLPVVLRFEDGKIGTRSGWLATELKSPVKLLLLASSDMLESTFESSQVFATASASKLPLSIHFPLAAKWRGGSQLRVCLSSSARPKFV